MSSFLDSSSDFSNHSIEEPGVLFPLPEDRSHYYSESECQICLCKFKAAGLSHTKKHFCLFCYHATCERCLNFEYFHSESRKIEPMCSKCHHKLMALSLDYSQELNNYRLKRIELRKEIKLAAQQKAFFVSERQIAEAKHVRVLGC